MKISEKRQSSRSAANESDAGYYLKLLSEEIRTVVASTVDDDGLPTTCAIDIMDWDENGLYFLTAKGKALYRRLKQNGYIAFTGIRGRDTLSSAAVSVQGRARELGSAKIPELFAKNPYMEAVYPDSASRAALTVFYIYEGRGEWFDLSKRPIERESFAFGGGVADTTGSAATGYAITEACTGCGACLPSCPQRCIDVSGAPAVIRQEHCLRCGNCMTVCPAHAVIQRRST